MILVILGTLAIVGVTIAVGVLIDRKLRLSPGPDDFDTDAQRQRKALVSHSAGEAPATALRLRDAQLVTLRDSQQCPRCGTAMRADAEDTVHYNDADLLVVHFTCPRCAATRSLYIDRVAP